jgi:hypothetical protein
VKVKEIMERAGMTETGRSIVYIKDAIEEMNLLAEQNVTIDKQNIAQDKRFYTLPKSLVKVLQIRCKNHLNSKDEFRKIPRLLHEPKIVDVDGQ